MRFAHYCTRTPSFVFVSSTTHTLPHIATLCACATLRPAATPRNTPQHFVPHCATLHHTSTVWCSVAQCAAECCGVLRRVAACCNTIRETTHCATLHHIPNTTVQHELYVHCVLHCAQQCNTCPYRIRTNCSTLQHTVLHCTTLQHTATHYATLYCTATICNKS